MKMCFYIFQTLDIQDYMPVILESLMRGIQVSIFFFDITTKKRTLAAYDTKDINDFLINLCQVNGIDTRLIKFNHFTKNSQKKYMKIYDSENFDFVITRHKNQIKYRTWDPIFDKNKVIYFIIKGVQILENPSSLMNVMRYENELYFPKNGTNNSFYFGVLRYGSTDHKNYFSPNTSSFINNNTKKTCFIIETWPRNREYKENGKGILIKVIDALKDLDYNIVYKAREKATSSDNTYADLVKDKVDLLIENDALNYPSSLFYFSKNSDMTINLDATSSILDSIYLSKMPVVIIHKNLSKKYRDFFKVCLGKNFQDCDKYVNLYDEKYNEDVKLFLKNATNRSPQLEEDLVENFEKFFEKVNEIWNSNQ